MLRFALALALSLFSAVASATDQADVPAKFTILWGNSAGTAYIRNIPTASQIGVQNCAASLTDGFPPLTFVPAVAGGCPPFGQDFNGILKQLSQWNQWQSMGGPILWDSALSAAIVGYPKGAVVANASTNGCYWLSSTDGNTSDPDTGGANWTALCPSGAGTATGATSGGSANAQTVTATPFVLQVGARITFTAGFANTGPLRINVNGAGLVNVYRKSQLGATMSVGGEVAAGQRVEVEWDGTRWQCNTCAVVRVGAGEDWFTTTAPPGALFRDGSAVSRATYADLFAVIGVTYGSGDGSTTFNLPDERGRTTIGRDTAGRITAQCPGAGTIASACGNTNAQIAIVQTNLPSLTLAGTTSGTLGGSGNLTGSTDAGSGSVQIPNFSNVTVITGNCSGCTSTGISQYAGNSSSEPVTVNSTTLSGSLSSFTSSGSLATSTPLGGSDTPLSTGDPTLVITKIIKF